MGAVLYDLCNLIGFEHFSSTFLFYRIPQKAPDSLQNQVPLLYVSCIKNPNAYADFAFFSMNNFPQSADKICSSISSVLGRVQTSRLTRIAMAIARYPRPQIKKGKTELNFWTTTPPRSDPPRDAMAIKLRLTVLTRPIICLGGNC